MSFILLGVDPDPAHAAVTADVEAVARIDGPLTITLQKDVQGIKVCIACLVTDLTAVANTFSHDWALL